MARTPGPVWAEFNTDLARSDDFKCLPDPAKAALATWGMLYPGGTLGPLPALAAAVVKTTRKTSTIVDDLVRAGFLKRHPGGPLTISDGWVREHKGSAQRMAKMRAGAKKNCDVTIEPKVTSHVTSHSADCDVTYGVTSDVTVTSQKEFPPTPPLRKTPKPPNGDFGECAQARDPRTKLPIGGKWRWEEGFEIPLSWQQRAAQEAETRGVEIDLAVICLDFSGHYSTDTNPRTYTEWMQKFLKWARNERPKWRANGTRHRPSQFEQLAEIARRESEKEFLPN